MSEFGLTEYCPVYAPFFGALGCCIAISFTCIGASYGTAKSGVGISAMAVIRPELMMKCSVPVVMASMIAIYGLVVSILISATCWLIVYVLVLRLQLSTFLFTRSHSLALIVFARAVSHTMTLYTGFVQLGGGLSVGLAGLASGFAIGIVGDAGVRGTAQQPKLFVGMVLILIFAEVLGLYGLIIALIMNVAATKGIETACLLR